MGNFIDLTGKTFARLTVLSRAENQSGNTKWNCLCSCGNLHVSTSSHLKSGHCRSCGCIKNDPTIMRKRSFSEQMEKYTITEPNSGCWLWIGATNSARYGSVYFNGKVVKAHRRSWEYHKGPIPLGLNVLHRCDNPPCINPDHLFLGTFSDNSVDMYAKGRGNISWPKGQDHARHKLTEAQAIEILSLDETCASIAKRFGVCRSTVGFIRSGKLWKYLGGRHAGI